VLGSGRWLGRIPKRARRGSRPGPGVIDRQNKKDWAVSARESEPGTVGGSVRRAGMPVLAAWCGGHCRSDRHGPASEQERWGKRLGMRWDSGQKRLAGVLDADRVSSGDCAEDGAGGLGSPCNVGAGRGPPEKMGQETRPRWRSSQLWAGGDSSCGGLSYWDSAATRQGWPVGRPQRSRRSRREPAESQPRGHGCGRTSG